MNAVRMAYTVLLAAGLGGALTFIGLYALRTPGWWKTPTGRWLMAIPGMLGALVGLALLGRVLHLPAAVWIIALCGFDVVEWWGVALLLIAQQRKGMSEGDMNEG